MASKASRVREKLRRVHAGAALGCSQERRLGMGVLASVQSSSIFLGRRKKLIKPSKLVFLKPRTEDGTFN